MIISINAQMKNRQIDIREFRRANKLQQRTLATLLNISIGELAKYERGFERPPLGIEAELAQIGKLESRHGHLLEPICGEGYVTSKAESGSTRHRTVDLEPNKHCIMDLFCGVGGFSHGFEETGLFQVSSGVDLLGDRLDTFCANHSSATAYGCDVRELAIKKVEQDNPRPFAVIGGPPCQGFSSLRPFRNIEWNDPRNNLGEEFVRVVAALKPEWVVFENVVGLVTHNKGKTLESISNAFQSLGYRTSARVLNGAQFGLPQKRERLILIGSLKGKAVDWPIPTHRYSRKSMAGKSDLVLQSKIDLFGLDLDDAVTFTAATSDLPTLASGQKSSTYPTDVQLTDYQKKMRSGASTLTLHEATNHSDKMLEIIKHAGANINVLPAGMVTSGFSSCYSRLAADEPSTTVTVNFVHPASNRCIHPTQNRALTPREGARLQSFEDTFKFTGTRSQTIKQIGNAVPPLLGKLIAETILRSD